MLRVTTYGTRGSIPVAGSIYSKYGGNTTCLRIYSDLLPDNSALIIDTGTGFVPCANDLLREEIKQVYILYTHWHYDHTLGLTLAPISYIKPIKIWMFGPRENGFGPKEMMADLFQPPKFPVAFRELESHFSFFSTDHANQQMAVIHPRGGVKLISLATFEKTRDCDGQITFKGQKHSLSECLIIKMHRSKHPERTISYRFEDPCNNLALTILTDHENEYEPSQSLLNHIKDSAMLIADAQYDEQTYKLRTAGFGHATPAYVVNLAIQGKVQKLGLIHHDPSSTDDKIDEILKEAQNAKEKFTGKNKPDIFVCKDFASYVIAQ